MQWVQLHPMVLHPMVFCFFCSEFFSASVAVKPKWVTVWGYGILGRPLSGGFPVSLNWVELFWYCFGKNRVFVVKHHRVG